MKWSATSQTAIAGMPMPILHPAARPFTTTQQSAKYEPARATKSTSAILTDHASSFKASDGAAFGFGATFFSPSCGACYRRKP
jgi:hypothetical protein